ncbi:aminoglycoside phosphotransferase family protein [Nonomuraea sp. NPDC059007]|uniref:aminoglycoside phosphotransferase family protein n=1 Tax=Nonomuraea sp. NPDC059007 TaxID=3346692 RepID=UPI00368AA956
MTKIEIPAKLISNHDEIGEGEEGGPTWIAGLPALAGRYLDEWGLRLDGDPMHGFVSLVLPVTRPDGVPAALKLQPVNDENASEAMGLKVWNGDAMVRLLDEDPSTGTLLLERLEGHRTLATVADDTKALTILADLLARLVAHPAPEGMRRLADIARDMIDETPDAVAALAKESDRAWLKTCASVVAELVTEPGDRLLHWDMHYENVLAAGREPWLAIDPKPLAGDPGFDLWPALDNRWDDVVATGDVHRAVRRRFDLLVDRLALDPKRAAGWTYGRLLQNALWDVQDGETELDEDQLAIAEALRPRL